ncbi:MAG TPA: heme peroxidase family protein [Chthoniobacterales bacterium]|jgi:hypothetical protein|nr:heme peroxidase family protein [Chthoniobacterales bacterium]
MTDDDHRPDGKVTAGYTYLGQFIDHDLTFDVTPLARAHQCAESVVNHRSPRLDLDQLYGGGPTVSPFLYHNNPRDRGKERFLIGPDAKNRLEYDLPRNREGIALVGDPRNDENLIIAQLHVAFLKFHNCVMNELAKGARSSIPNAGPAGATLFEQTRRLVTWHYQYLVIKDFLFELLDPDVYNGLELDGPPPVRSNSTSFRIPIEFSAAAYRFGHSMVRNTYPINKDHLNVPLSDLLNYTGTGGGAAPILPPEWKIEWDRLFIIDKPFPRLSRAIDTKIANGLHSLGPQTVKVFNAPAAAKPPPSKSGEIPPEYVLPVRTLWRSARMGLPSGQDVARALGLVPLNSYDIAPDNGPHTETLRCYVFDKDTPLWYYVLKEAELPEVAKGRHLGPVGSRIVANVIMAALRTDPSSYLTVDPSWQPALPTKGEDQIAKILRFIDASTAAPQALGAELNTDRNNTSFESGS